MKFAGVVNDRWGGLNHTNTADTSECFYFSISPELFGDCSRQSSSCSSSLPGQWSAWGRMSRALGSYFHQTGANERVQRFRGWSPLSLLALAVDVGRSNSNLDRPPTSDSTAPNFLLFCSQTMLPVSTSCYFTRCCFDGQLGWRFSTTQSSSSSSFSADHRHQHKHDVAFFPLLLLLLQGLLLLLVTTRSAGEENFARGTILTFFDRNFRTLGPHWGTIRRAYRTPAHLAHRLHPLPTTDRRDKVADFAIPKARTVSRPIHDTTTSSMDGWSYDSARWWWRWHMMVSFFLRLFWQMSDQWVEYVRGVIARRCARCTGIRQVYTQNWEKSGFVNLRNELPSN